MGGCGAFGEEYVVDCLAPLFDLIDAEPFRKNEFHIEGGVVQIVIVMLIDLDIVDGLAVSYYFIRKFSPHAQMVGYGDVEHCLGLCRAQQYRKDYK